MGCLIWGRDKTERIPAKAGENEEKEKERKGNRKKTGTKATSEARNPALKTMGKLSGS
jgi:hypothetical protein